MRVLALVEGQTEEQFLKRLLQPHLAERGIDLQATMVVTSREEGRRAHRGGVTSYRRIHDDLRLLLRSKPAAVTTLFDVYGFPKDLPGYPDPWPSTTRERASRLAQAFEADLGDHRFFAGFCVHEFEGLLFTDVDVLAATIEPDEDARLPLAQRLAEVRAAFPTPEDIDSGPQSAPSKRVLAVAKHYAKTRHGPTAAERIGLPTLRAACPLFSAWVTRLESLAGDAQPRERGS